MLKPLFFKSQDTYFLYVLVVGVVLIALSLIFPSGAKSTAHVHVKSATAYVQQEPYEADYEQFSASDKEAVSDCIANKVADAGGDVDAVDSDMFMACVIEVKSSEE